MKDKIYYGKIGTATVEDYHKEVYELNDILLDLNNSMLYYKLNVELDIKGYKTFVYIDIKKLTKLINKLNDTSLHDKKFVLKIEYEKY